MSLLRGLLFDNLGLKFVALLLAVLVYLNVYTDRPATMIVSFPIRVTDLAGARFPHCKAASARSRAGPRTLNKPWTGSASSRASAPTTSARSRSSARIRPAF